MGVETKTTPQEASLYVKNIWENLTDSKDVSIKEGKLKFEDAKAAIKTIIALTKDELGGETSSLEELESLFNTILDDQASQKNKLTKTAIAGILGVLKEASIVGLASDKENKALYDQVQTIQKTITAKLYPKGLSGWVHRLKENIAAELKENKIHVKEYRDALENAQKTITTQKPTPIALHITAYNLKIAANKESPKPTLFKRFLESFLEFLNSFNEIEKAVQVDLRIKEITKKTDIHDSTTISEKELKKLYSVSNELDQKRLISHNHFLSLQIIQAQAQFKTGNKEIALKTIKSLSKYVNADLRMEISKLSVDSDVSDFNEVSNELKDEILDKARPFNYLYAIEILNRPRSKKSDQLKLNSREKEIITSFLTYARANKFLNEYLMDLPNRTPVEESLCAYTWITLQEKQDCSAEIAKVTDILKSTGLQEFKDLCHHEDSKRYITKDCLDYFFCEDKDHKDRYLGSFVDCLEHVVGQGFLRDGKGEKAKDNDDFKELRKLFLKMQFSPYLPKATQQFSPAHIDAVKAMKIKLGEMKPSQAIIAAKKEIATYLEKLEEGRTLIKKLEAEAKKSTYSEEKISIEELHTLEQYSVFSGIFDILPDGVKFPPEIASLRTNSTEADDSIRTLDELLQLLPSYQPGDISQDHEVMKKAFQGKSRNQVYSLKGQCSASEVPSFIKEFLAKGPFAVQPRVDGPITHSSMTIVDLDTYKRPTVRRIEILTDFENELAGFIGSLTSISYRPNLNKLLTPASKKIIKGKEERVKQIFAEETHKYFIENEEKFHTYKNDCRKAALAFINKFSWLKGPATAILNRVFPELPPAPGTQNLFCSELVVMMMKDIQERVNKALNEEFKSNINHFEAIFTLRPEETTPNDLQKILVEYYTQVPPPLVTRLLLGNNFGPEFLKGKLK